MKPGLISTIVFCLLSITACAPVHPKIQELQLPPERIVQEGYSLVPLNEPGWLIAEKNQYSLVLGKKGMNPDETIAIQAMFVRLAEFKTTEDFVYMVKDGQAKDTDPQRFIVKKHEAVASSIEGSSCVKSYLVTEDKAAVKRSGKAGNMVLEALTLTCRHPKNISVGVNVSYSHRYYPGQGDSAFIEKATRVLESLKFNDL